MLKKNGKYGVVNESGVEITVPKYNYIGRFYGNLSVIKENDKYGYINTKGHEIIPAKFDAAENFSAIKKDLAKVKVSGQWYYIDITGSIVERFIEDCVFRIGPNNKWGVVNLAREWVIQPIFDNIKNYVGKRGFGQYKGLWHMIDKQGDDISKKLYQDVYPFYEDVALVKSSGKWGLINKFGEEIIVPKFTHVIENFTDNKSGLATVALGNINYSLDIKGNVVLLELIRFQSAKDKKLWGLKKTNGIIILEPRYQKISEFRRGFAIVELNSLYGYIDSNGKETVKPIYSEIYWFDENGISKVKKNGVYIYIDINGKEVDPPTVKPIGIPYLDFGNWPGGTRAVVIGDQTWINHNLSVVYFRNGKSIKQAKTDRAWAKAAKKKRPAWRYCKNQPSLDDNYGKMYNWYAVSYSGGLCPNGWHVPSIDEWNVLYRAIGGNKGEMLKSVSDWESYGNANAATDHYGFHAVPAGMIWNTGNSAEFEEAAYWWTATYNDLQTAKYLKLNSASSINYNSYNKGIGLSVRCVKSN